MRITCHICCTCALARNESIARWCWKTRCHSDSCWTVNTMKKIQGGVQGDCNVRYLRDSLQEAPRLIPSSGKRRRNERHSHRIANDKTGTVWRQAERSGIVHTWVVGSQCILYILYMIFERTLDVESNWREPFVVRPKRWCSTKVSGDEFQLAQI